MLEKVGVNIMLSTGSAAEKDSAFGKLHIGSGGIGAMAAWILTAIRALPGLVITEDRLGYDLPAV